MQQKILQYIASNGLDALKRLCYVYSEQFSHSCILDSCQLNTGVHVGSYELMAAFGARQTHTNLIQLQNGTNAQKWMFGALGYDLKNEFEDLTSTNTPIIQTPDLLFFEPMTLLLLDKNGVIELQGEPLEESFWQPPQLPNHHKLSSNQNPLEKHAYLQKIKTIHELIRSGDVYELNYCVPHTHNFEAFSATRFQIDLIQKSSVPMASYLKTNHLYLCGASMERYLHKKGTRLISQPIKGTIRKGATVREDKLLIKELQTSEKDRAENVMIVDLVRNDLNRICQRGTVRVAELFGIYSYLQVHQMISTVEGKVNPDVSLTDILRATFPMGSMTGAPKIAATRHIDTLENFKRGWYSGAVGYITPTGDFDFNVVIRSVICDMKKKQLNYNAGGAITIDSVPEQEWSEVQLKVKAIKETLGF